jgi:hypothetical protein
VLSGLEERLDDFDAMDRLEILCAAAHIEPGGGYQYRLRIAEMLQPLPSCTASNLRMLGMTIELDEQHDHEQLDKVASWAV